MEHQGRELRHELKFAINDIEHRYLRSRLKTLINQDLNVDSSGDYHIRSLYFDNYADSSYIDKEAGVFQRGKYRIRIYNKEDTVIKLEYKEKFDSYIAKTSRTISRSLYEQILHRQIRFSQVKEDPFMLKFYLETKMNLLAPKVIVDYIREPYVYPAGNVRITFDKKLKAGIRELDIFAREPLMMTPQFSGTMILEVKYDDYIPEFIRRGLNLARHQQLAVSKYTICRDLRSAFDWRERNI